MSQWVDPDPGHAWPAEFRAALDLNPANCTVRLALADWFEEQDQCGEATLIEALRFMGFAGKWPATKFMSGNVHNLARGYAWFSDSIRKHAVVPMEIRPLRVARARGYMPRRVSMDWVWGTRQKAEDWFVSCWTDTQDEVRKKLLEEVWR